MFVTLLIIPIITALISIAIAYFDYKDKKKKMFIGATIVSVASVFLIILQSLNQHKIELDSTAKDKKIDSAYRELDRKSTEIAKLQKSTLVQTGHLANGQNALIDAQGKLINANLKISDLQAGLNDILIEKVNNELSTRKRNDKRRFVITMKDIRLKTDYLGFEANNFLKPSDDDSMVEKNYALLKNYVKDLSKLMENEFDNEYLEQNPELKLCFDTYYNYLQDLSRQLYYGPNSENNFKCFHKFRILTDMFCAIGGETLGTRSHLKEHNDQMVQKINEN